MSQAPYFVTQNNYGGEFRQFPGVIQAAGPRVQNGDWLALAVTTTNDSGVIEINGRILTDVGEIVPFTGKMTFSGTGTQTAIVARLGGGWLQGFDVHRVSGTLADGQVVAAVHLGTGEGTTARYECCLASGEVTTIRALGMGTFADTSTGIGAGSWLLSRSVVANPAAGSVATYTVPSGKIVKFVTISAFFQTSAVAANRLPYLWFTDSYGSDLFALTPVTQTASLTYWYQFQSYCLSPFSQGTYRMASLPGDLIFLPGSTVQFYPENIDVGDQITDYTLTYLQKT